MFQSLLPFLSIKKERDKTSTQLTPGLCNPGGGLVGLSGDRGSDQRRTLPGSRTRVSLPSVRRRQTTKSRENDFLPDRRETVTRGTLVSAEGVETRSQRNRHFSRTCKHETLTINLSCGSGYDRRHHEPSPDVYIKETGHNAFCSPVHNCKFTSSKGYV